MENPNWKDETGKFGEEKKEVPTGEVTKRIKEHRGIVAAVAVIVAVAVIGIFTMTNKEPQAEVVATAEADTVEATETSVASTPEELLEKDAYPEVNELVKQYFQALVDGDIETLHKIKNHTDEEEELKIVKKSEFIESYPVLTVYTKKGPEEGSYVAYVHYEVKFYDYETTAPGLNTLYICTDENGKHYINSGELDETVVEYLKDVSLQNEVLDLFNTVQVAYNDVKTNDAKLSTFLDELPELLAESVSEAIAEQVAEEEALNQEAEEEVPEEVVVVTKVKTTEVVNVRSSDSIEADKIGKTSLGQVLELVEAKVNGWSKVIFEGKEGFIKSEFLEPEETETRSNVEEGADDAADGEDDASDSEGGNTSTTTGHLTDNVNVRKTPSTSGDKLGKLSAGSSVDIIEKQSDGWTKIKYQDGEAYIKSDYIE